MAANHKPQPIPAIALLLVLSALSMVLANCSSDDKASTAAPGDDEVPTDPAQPPATSSPSEDPPAVSGNATITAANALELLAFVIDTANGTPLEPFNSTVKALYPAGVFGDDSVDATLGLQALDSQPSPDAMGPPPVVYACDRGGQYVFTDSGSATGGGSGVFDRCTLSGLAGGMTMIDGGVSRVLEIIKYVFNPGSTTYTAFDDMALTAGDTLMSLDGTVSDSVGPQSSSRIDDATLTGSSAAGDTRIVYSAVAMSDGAEYEGSPSASPWQRTFSASLQVSAPATDQQTLTVNTTTPFVTSAAGLCYESGSLTITAEDGSSLRMQAGNGDPDSFQLDISSAGSVTSLTQGWSDRFELKQLTTGQAEAPVVGDGQPGSACAITDRQTDLLR